MRRRKSGAISRESPGEPGRALGHAPGPFGFMTVAFGMV